MTQCKTDGIVDRFENNGNDNKSCQRGSDSFRGFNNSIVALQDLMAMLSVLALIILRALLAVIALMAIDYSCKGQKGCNCSSKNC